jgi:hypothetical protein
MYTVNQKQKRSGRPTRGSKKEVRAGVRFATYEYFIIREKASQSGMSISDYIRQTAIDAKITQRLTQEELALARQMVGMSVNINQVAKVCHREGLFEAMKYFENYRNLIDSILKKLKP